MSVKHAETVTFGGSGLDRAAEIRGDAHALATAKADARSTSLVLWRGKVLATGDKAMQVVRLSLAHPIFAEAKETPILIGREKGAAVFAHDISLWVPEDLDPSLIGAFVDPTEQRHPSLAPENRFVELRRVMTRLSPRDAELAATAKAILGWHESHGFCSKCGAASKMAMSGWQRDCPACGARHFPRTDPVVIMLILHGNRVLLGRSPGWPEGMYSCLAGFVEPGETLEAAVRREVFEEAGVHVGDVGYLASQPWPFPASLMIGCVGYAETDKIKIDPEEIEDARWVTREDVMDAFAGNRADLLPARKGAIAHFLLQNWLADTLD